MRTDSRLIGAGLEGGTIKAAQLLVAGRKRTVISPPAPVAKKAKRAGVRPEERVSQMTIGG
ncbi:MAG: hypothetical protein ACYC9O_02480 [Candidatus Latescibacterota bacterium]